MGSVDTIVRMTGYAIQQVDVVKPAVTDQLRAKAKVGIAFVF
jgi:hypothetical protein